MQKGSFEVLSSFLGSMITLSFDTMCPTIFSFEKPIVVFLRFKIILGPSSIERLIQIWEGQKLSHYKLQSHQWKLIGKWQQWFKFVFHQTMKCLWNIAQTKGHYYVTKCSPWCGECGLQLILWNNFHLMVAFVPISKCVHFMPYYLFQFVFTKWQKVSVFLNYLV